MVGSLCITLDPPGPCPGGGRGQKLVNLQNVVFLRQMFLEVHILTTTHGKSGADWRSG